jgi:uncharacterized protein (TIGR03067 family)
MRFTLAPIALCFLVAADPAPEVVKKDVAQLQGTWSMVSGERDGEAVPAEYLKEFKRVAKDDVTTVTLGETVFLKAKFTLDPSKKPKTIDYTLLDGPAKGKKQLGIYEIDGDTMKFCFASPDQERPKEFSTKGTTGRTLSTWKRDKP